MNTITSNTCRHEFRAGEIVCLLCLAHREDCDCTRCQPDTPSTGCPSWCTIPDEPFEWHSAGAFVRAHQADLSSIQTSDGGKVEVTIEAEDQLTVTATGVDLVRGVPTIALNTEGPVQLTAAQARQLAADLSTASAFLRSVTE